METTETLGSTDGSIEGAIAAMLQPEEGATTETDSISEEAVESLIEPETPEEVEEEPEDVEEQQPESEGDEPEDDDEEVGDSDEDEHDTEEAETEQEQQMFTVKVDGKSEAVTLDDLKRGYSGQKYING